MLSRLYTDPTGICPLQLRLGVDLDLGIISIVLRYACLITILGIPVPLSCGVC